MTKGTKCISNSLFLFLVALCIQPLFSGETYEYDAQGRLTRVTYGDSISITYTYDLNSNILSIEVGEPLSVTEPEDELLPMTFALEQNFPNPFNPGTTIKYQLPVVAQVRITIYNLLGKQVRTLIDEQEPAGYHSTEWNGLNNNGIEVTSGIYLCRILAVSLRGDRFSQTRKLTLIK